ncbi:hypothetical protein THRCLA_20368 [Thraustotheca clavata]|uniref:Uncharacterized protein n=1 Tax=Thraustotheca clavata TaxID=74557 RepID=A0A1W0A855_9STRA|nr:hypothetical protein THRCLA_20368 [Thraustotheca clavata]
MNESVNPIAERRRLRVNITRLNCSQLEKLRLEREAAEALERERLHIENERIARELEQQALYAKQLDEKACRQAELKAEEDRIKNLIEQEHNIITGLEKHLMLLGAYCINEISLHVMPIAIAIVPHDEYSRGWQNYVNKYLILDTASLLHLFSTTQQLTSQKLRTQTPVAMTVSCGGLLCVTDTNLNCVHIYNFSTMFCDEGFKAPELIHVVGSKGSRSGEFNVPRGIALDFIANELYVCDTMNRRVQVFSIESKALSLKTPLSRIIGRDILVSPSGVDLSHYHVVIADTVKARINIFSKRGDLINHYGSKGHDFGQFWDIRDVKLCNVRKKVVNLSSDQTNYNEYFNIVVADMGNYRIQVIKEDGTIVYVFSHHVDIPSLKHHLSIMKEISTRLIRELEKVDLHHIASQISTLGPTEAGKKLSHVLHPSSTSYESLISLYQCLSQEKHDIHMPLAIDIARNQDNAIVLCDRDNYRVCVYNYSGPKFEWFNISDSLTTVSGLAVVNNKVFAVDSNNHRVNVYHQTISNKAIQWTFDRYLGAATYGSMMNCAPGFEPGELHSPTDIAVYSTPSSNWLLISDTANHRIQIFDAETFVFIHQIGVFGRSKGCLNAPFGICVKDTLVYCADQRNHRIVWFDIITCNYVGGFGRQGNGAGEFVMPTYIAVAGALPSQPGIDFGPHRQEKIVVSDTGNCRVQVLSLDGELFFILKYAPQGITMVPMGVYIDARSGALIVCDISQRAAVLLFRSDGTFFQAFGGTLPDGVKLHKPVALFHYVNGEIDRFLVADAGRCDVCAFIMTKKG